MRDAALDGFQVNHAVRYLLRRQNRAHLYRLCDDHPEPLKELRRLVRLQRAYAHANRGDELMTEIREREYEVFDRSLDVQISRLRKLIEPDPATPRYIQTVWGLGYVFIPDGIKA